MKTARRITSNFISLALSELISKIIQIIIFIYLARIFGKLEFGKFGFGFAFATIIAVIADFGINTLLIREISRDKKNVGKYVSNALTIKCFLSLITFFIASIFLIIGKYSKDTVAIAYIMLVFMVLQTFTDLFYSVFRAFEKMYYDA
ncbi:oligosaccharide flippase family protein, partial [Candidatus Woesearchaeota archaeon]|nr:oligosaccharide flippase family protein [Candidatus Woesearchaeota archaeon]